ncbi:ribonuclease P protein subunit p25-like protein [Bufo gargarizans]|uniref:ribonuclease P protein subunit p25-like protein n=1 Tax=Bufo bufo TaxID=8384 RepID=UPI001ABDB0CF|nr:ribonuclease P protein subunit p25-like protein [Bufo bufo]XP_044132642.1 ribonuclease P protein subunit p25-like protein [Bufo gargarizans]XP_044132643.1 ribonuclease P protein subunit p25-like protein [Bufo gargarizans]
MENYKKVRVEDKPMEMPFAALPPDIIEMKVKDGSKIRNLMSFAIGKMESESVRQILFSGTGKALSKTITCVEIMKRRVKDLHQITKILYRPTEEIWEPIVPEVGLDPLTVKRNSPSICVLLSKDPLDTTEPGYQAPGDYDSMWIQELKVESKGPKRRKPGLGRGASIGRKQPRPPGGRGETPKKA